jgi:hypothetical protein
MMSSSSECGTHYHYSRQGQGKKRAEPPIGEKHPIA